MPKSQYLVIAFTVLCALQLLFPLLATVIKSRFKKLGYEMNAEPMWSLFNVTTFWREARTQNELYKDAAISRLLFVRTTWWLMAIATFVGLLASGGW